MLRIVNAPAPVLSQKAKPVLKIDKNILILIQDMKKALDVQKDPEGVGLAAPQVGKSLQIFISKPSKTAKYQTFINPSIIASKQEPMKKKKSHSTKLEGCLSLVNIWGEVKRAESITLKYQDEKGDVIEKTFTGFSATIVQHEMDHLEGILFPKRVLEQNGTLYKSHKDKHGKDVFDPIEI